MRDKTSEEKIMSMIKSKDLEMQNLGWEIARGYLDSHKKFSLFKRDWFPGNRGFQPYAEGQMIMKFYKIAKENEYNRRLKK